jgi:short-subunit dehydrogenase
VSWYVYPFNGTYCVTKHAALAMTDDLRLELMGQGTWWSFASPLSPKG